MSWFETIEFPHQIFRIREPALKPLHGSNAWLIRGAYASLLIDAGIGVAPLRPVVEALCPGPIVCLLTHSHYDHIGGAHEFADRRAHRAEAHILSDPNPEATQWGGWLGPDSFLSPPHPDFDFADYAIRPAPPTWLIEDGDRIELGDRVVTLLHVPGHSPGLVCAFEERTGALFSSDALYDGRMFFDLKGSDREAGARGIERLLAQDVEVVYPGHFECLSSEAFRRVGAKVIAELSRGKPTRTALGSA